MSASAAFTLTNTTRAAAIALQIAVVAILITTSASQSTTTPTSYTNHTVGGNVGWFFNSTTNSSFGNYSAWAASSQPFYLGDYLIFNTSSNETVVQTYNDTTFKSCSTDDASDTDTSLYMAGNAAFGEPLTIAIPLTIVGSNYFFSDLDDGIQCQHGMAFEINVGRGLGLPPSLNQPPPPPYAEPPSSDTNQTPPVEGSTTGNGGGMHVGANMQMVACVVVTVMAVLSIQVF